MTGTTTTAAAAATPLHQQARGISSAPSNDFSEASSSFMMSGGNDNAFDADFTQFPSSTNFFIQKNVATEMVGETSQPVRGNDSNRNNNNNNNNNSTELVGNASEETQKDSSMMLMEKVQASKNSSNEDTCGTEITESEGCDTISLTSSKPENVKSSPAEDLLNEADEEEDAPKEYEDCFSGQAETPMMMTQEPSQTATSDADAEVVKPEEQSVPDEEEQERTSLDAPVVAEESEAPTTMDTTARVHDEEYDTIAATDDSKVRLSKAAQEVLNEPEEDDAADVSKAVILQSLQTEAVVAVLQDQAVTERALVKEPPKAPTRSCDDRVLDLCNGMADSTLYACHVFMCMFEEEGDEDESQMMFTEDGEIFIPEEEVPQEEEQEQVDPTFPQVVRKGHVLSHIVESEEGNPLFLSQQHQQQEEDTTVSSPVSERSRVEEQEGQSQKFNVMAGTRAKGFPKSTDDAFDYADADASSAFEGQQQSPDRSGAFPTAAASRKEEKTTAMKQ